MILVEEKCVQGITVKIEIVISTVAAVQNRKNLHPVGDTNRQMKDHRKLQEEGDVKVLLQRQVHLRQILNHLVKVERVSS